MNAIRHIEVHCPSCGSAGEIEREISIPDPIRGGDIIGRIETCDTCEGRGAVDPLDHEPWEPCIYAAEKLMQSLEAVADASCSDAHSTTNQEVWNEKIQAALSAFQQLKNQIDVLKEWKQ